MEGQNENIQFTQQPTPMDASVQSTQPQNTNVVYASFFERFMAAAIDGILILVAELVLFIPVFALGMTPEEMNPIAALVSVLGWVYFVFMDYKYGRTLGKKAMKLRVQHVDTGKNLDILHAILREVIGKIVSSIPLSLGYYWMIWDPKKQTWHDKLGSSVVVKIQ